MSNQKISALPLKTTPNSTDVIPIVDVQLGPTNYINKKTTFGSIFSITDARTDAKIAELNFVAAVNGKGGNVVLNLSDIGNVSLPSVSNNFVLAYNQSLDAWTGVALTSIDETLDGGEF